MEELQSFETFVKLFPLISWPVVGFALIYWGIRPLVQWWVLRKRNGYSGLPGRVKKIETNDLHELKELQRIVERNHLEYCKRFNHIENEQVKQGKDIAKIQGRLNGST